MSFQESQTYLTQTNEYGDDIEELLYKAYQNKRKLNNTVTDIPIFLQRKLSSHLTKMNLAGNIQMEGLVYRKRNLEKMYQKIKQTRKKDNAVVSLGDERGRWRSISQSLEQQASTYSKRLSKHRLSCSNIEEDVRSLRMKLKQLNLNAMQLQFKVSQLRQGQVQGKPKRSRRNLSVQMESVSEMPGEQDALMRLVKQQLLQTQKEIKKIVMRQNSDVLRPLEGYRFFDSCLMTYNAYIKSLQKKSLQKHASLVNSTTSSALNLGIKNSSLVSLQSYVEEEALDMS